MLVAISAASIALLTLRPITGARDESVDVVCLLCKEGTLRDLLLNIALYVPFGLGLSLLGASTAGAGAISLLLTLAIEGLQTRLPGRFASGLDVATNAAGGLLGAWLANRLATTIRPSTRAARTLTIAAGVVWVGACFVSAWGLAPTPRLPRSITGSEPICFRDEYSLGAWCSMRRRMVIRSPGRMSGRRTPWSSEG